MTPAIAPTAAAPGLHFGDLYAIALLAGGAALLLAVVALSRESGRAFTSATVYLFMGAAASVGLSAFEIGLLDPLKDSVAIERAAELAVVIALFSAGIRLDRRLSWRGWGSTVRLIGVAMPLTIGLVAVLGNLVMGLSWGAAIVLAAALAPTDPVLAGEIQVGPPGEEGEEEPRFALTSEAGLNDGLAFPFVFLGLLVAEPAGPSLTSWLLADVLYAIVVGILVGAVAGWVLAAATSALREREWLLAEYDGWLAIAGVLIAYGSAEVLGSYGFLAAFAGGLAFRRREREHEYHQPVHRGIAEIERVSELALVLLLGSTVTLVGLSEPGIGGWVLALALLFVIRPAAVLVSFLGSRMPRSERLFIGWFGVRGVGSFYYVAVAIGAGALSAAESTEIYWTVIACVGLSILLHGLTATPASRGLGLEQGPET